MTKAGPMMLARTLAVGLCAAGALLAMPARGVAQSNYPDHPVRVIVPFGPGGVADITIRIVSEKLGQKLGQRFIVENNPGAGGITAARAAISAGPDGYTLAMLTNGTAVSVPLFKNLTFDPMKDFVPVSSLGFFDFVFVTNAQAGIGSVGDFIAQAKAKPGALNIGTVNRGSTQNLSAELFKSSTGTDFTIVPFRTTPDLTVALLRNDVQLVIDSYAALKAGLSDGKLKAIATSGPKRFEGLPAIPTVAEQGVKGFDVTSWNALFVPTGTPKPVIDKLNAALVEILAEPDVKKRLLDLGIEAKASTPDAISARLKDDVVKWGAVIKQAGVEQQ
jgi:tripartite-type tricarboxylate transporter receptor subunit TctC